MMRSAHDQAGELGSEDDLVAQGVEASDKAFGHAVLVLPVEMSGTEFTELGALGESVEDRDQDLVSNRHRGPLGAQPRLESKRLPEAALRDC